MKPSGNKILSSCRQKEPTVASFDPIENVWTEVGKLQVARSYLGVVQLDESFLVIGGDNRGQRFSPLDTDPKIESCNLSFRKEQKSPKKLRLCPQINESIARKSPEDRCSRTIKLDIDANSMNCQYFKLLNSCWSWNFSGDKNYDEIVGQELFDV